MKMLGIRIYNLDLTKEEHVSYFQNAMQCGQTELAWKEHFENYVTKVKGGNYPQAQEFQTLLQYSEGTDDLVDAFFISKAGINRSTNELEVEFVSAFKEDIAELYWSVELPGDGKAVSGGSTDIRGYRKSLSIELDKVSEKKEALIYLSWRSIAGDVVKTQVQQFTAYALPDEVEDFSLTNPVKKSSLHDFIMVVYNRSAQGEEQPDYTKPEKLINDRQELLLECSGEIRMPEGKKIQSLVDCQMIMTTDHGSAAYQNARTYVNVKDGNLVWNMPDTWNTYVPTKRLSLQDEVVLDVTFYVMLQDGSITSFSIKSQKPEAQQDSSTYAYQASGNINTLNIHTLRLLWGCVAEDTFIVMADGREKAIRSVCIGDIIQSLDGNFATVENIYVGYEKEIYVLSLEDYYELKATDSHAILTENGYKPMCKLSVGDRIQTRDGLKAVVSLEKKAYTRKVYTLELSSEDHSVLCNRIAVGDFFRECSLKR